MRARQADLAAFCKFSMPAGKITNKLHFQHLKMQHVREECHHLGAVQDASLLTDHNVSTHKMLEATHALLISDSGLPHNQERLLAASAGSA